ncbi:MAG: hypothetical protein R3D62_20445 [Xanthobacteraceae bacterium]
MNAARLRTLPALLAFALTLAIARAEDLAGFHAALDVARQHSRSALAHLHAGDTPLAVMEISRLRESFGLLIERYGAERRAAHKDRQEYATAVVDIPLRLVTAQMMIDFGRPDIAASSLLAVCRALGVLQESPESADATRCQSE